MQINEIIGHSDSYRKKEFNYANNLINTPEIPDINNCRKGMSREQLNNYMSIPLLHNNGINDSYVKNRRLSSISIESAK
jgi:hypothetical protein